jgi:hypothetical protein
MMRPGMMHNGRPGMMRPGMMYTEINNIQFYIFGERVRS